MQLCRFQAVWSVFFLTANPLVQVRSLLVKFHCARLKTGSRLRRMVDTPSCLQIGQEPGLRPSRRGVRAGRSHLPPTRQLPFIDKVTHLSCNCRFIFFSLFISKERGPPRAAPKGGRQLWWQDPVKDVPLEQHQDEAGDLQEAEEQKESPREQERGQAEEGANLSQLFPTALSSNTTVGPCSVLGTTLPAQDWSEGPRHLAQLYCTSPQWAPKSPATCPPSWEEKKYWHFSSQRSPKLPNALGPLARASHCLRKSPSTSSPPGNSPQPSGDLVPP